MSNATNPFTAMFDMQRRSMEQSQKAFHQSLEFQKQATKLFRESLHSQKSVQQKGMDVSKTAVEAYLDMLEATVPGDEATYDSLHEAVEEQFEAFHEISDQSWEAFEGGIEENSTAYDEFVDDYASYVDDSVDAYKKMLGQAEEQTEVVAETIDVSE